MKRDSNGGARGRGRERLSLALLLLAAAVVYLLCLRDGWRPAWDSGIYLSLARSIARGEGYAYGGASHVVFPPGFPLLCAPVLAVFGSDFLALRLLVTAFALASVVLGYEVIRAYGEKALALPAAALFAFSYAVVEALPGVLSDFPYAAFALGALLAYRRFRDGGRWRDGAALAALAVAALSTRLVGATLVLAIGVSLLVRRLRRKGPSWGRLLLVGFLVAAPALAWIARAVALRASLPERLPGVPSYESVFVTHAWWSAEPVEVGFLGWWERVARQALVYRALVVEVFSGCLLDAYMFDETALLAVVATVGAGLVAWAFARAARRHRSAAELYVALTFAVLVAYPIPQGARYFLPVLPLLFAYGLAGVRDLGTRLLPGKRLAQGVGFTLVVAAIAASSAPRVVGTVRRERAEPYQDAGTEAFFRAAAWLRENAASNSFVLADESPAVTFLSGLRGRSLPLTSSGAALADFVRRLAADDPGTPVYLLLSPVGQFGLLFFWPALREAKTNGWLGGTLVHEEVVRRPDGGEGGAAVFLLDI